jgi:hypothetical protein
MWSQNKKLQVYPLNLPTPIIPSSYIPNFVTHQIKWILVTDHSYNLYI